MTKSHDEWITYRQAANTLGVTVQRVGQLVRDGRLPFRKVNGNPRGEIGRPITIHVSRKAVRDRQLAQEAKP